MPIAPIRTATSASISGTRKYAKDFIVRSPMWPSDNVYNSGCCTSAEEISPGVGSDQTFQTLPAISRTSDAARRPTAFVPRRIHRLSETIAAPRSRANAGWLGNEEYSCGVEEL